MNFGALLKGPTAKVTNPRSSPALSDAPLVSTRTRLSPLKETRLIAHSGGEVKFHSPSPIARPRAGCG